MIKQIKSEQQTVLLKFINYFLCSDSFSKIVNHSRKWEKNHLLILISLDWISSKPLDHCT